MNLPNSITMSRIVMIPLLLWILTPHFPWHAHGAQEITASVLFVLASITDGLDGYLARKREQITTMGVLLDPIADKIMVAGALIALVAYNPEVVQGLDRGGHHRPRVSHQRPALHCFVGGLHHPGQRPGQAQDGCPDRLRRLRHPGPWLDQWQFGMLIIPVKWIAIAAIYFTVLVSSISAIDYFVGFWKQIDHASKDRRKSSVLTRRKKASTP